jgi:hypothetical protein
MKKCKFCGKIIIDTEILGYCSLNCLGGYKQNRNKQKKSNLSNSYSPQVIFDYHGYNLYEAKNKICDDLMEAYDMGYTEVRLIHGYKHGQSIRSYIWGSNGLIKEINKVRPDIRIQRLKTNSKGVTRIRFT